MLISVLIPSRNRLELIKSTIATVQLQKFNNWEIIISDNASDEPYGPYIESLNDPRIKCIRTENFVSVTANWNRCIDAATGDYIVMLGDDDGLTPHYMTRVCELVEQFNNPDFIYHSAWNYIYPKAILAQPESRLIDTTPTSLWFENITTPELISHQKAEYGARCALKMKSRYGFNMQYFLFSSAFIKKLKKYGPVFQGPFPDFYTAQMAMLLAERAVIAPEPLIFIGISPKSYGYFYYNQKEDKGVEFLNSLIEKEHVPDDVLGALIPGSNMNTSWLMSVAIVKEKLNQIYPDLKLGVTRYRLMQIRDALRQDRATKNNSQIKTLWPHLKIRERVLVYGLYAFTAGLQVLPKPIRDHVLRIIKIEPTEPKYASTEKDNRYGSLLDAFKALS